MHTFRRAFRSLARTPGFTTIAVLTLALGIGINTAMFSILNGFLLRPLTFPAGERLFRLEHSTTQQPREDLSPANVVDVTAGATDVLATYLLGGERTHLSNFHIRERNEIIQDWTAPFVPGPTYAGKPVFFFTGPETASAAESFAYNLQALKRIQVVGRKTAGAANPGGFVRVSEHFAVFIPDGRPVNPITRTNWEGVGVQPDVDVDVASALRRAHQLALEGLLEQPGADPDETQQQRDALASLRAE